MTKGLLLAALMVSWSGARAQVPEEKRPEFVATGAVVTFDEICLKIYTDHDKANAWMRGAFQSGRRYETCRSLPRGSVRPRIFRRQLVGELCRYLRRGQSLYRLQHAR